MTIKNTLETSQIYYKIRYYIDTVEELVMQKTYLQRSLINVKFIKIQALKKNSFTCLYK